MTDYVVGFMREALSDRVLMVRKTKPAWQDGLLNGVGGKVDHTVDLGGGRCRLESPIEAMVREFKEETGIDTKASDWRLVLFMDDPRDFYTGAEGGTVYWFVATWRFLPKVPPRVLDSGEELLTVRIPDLLARTDVLASPKWVIPMAFGDPTLQVLGSDPNVVKRGRDATITVNPLSGLIRKVVSENSELHRKVESLEAAWPIKGDGPVGCKKFLHRDGALLCNCEVGKCQGVGIGAADLERINASGEMVKRPWPDRDDMVANKAGTEKGRVLARFKDTVWVQSEKYPDKRVTLYIDDLIACGGVVRPNAHVPGGGIPVNVLPLVADPGQAGQAVNPGAPTRTLPAGVGEFARSIPLRPTTGLLPPLPGKPGAFVQALDDPRTSRFPINLRSVGPDGHDKVVPGDVQSAMFGHDPTVAVRVPNEPAETPDAEWHGGAQEHFGGGTVHPMRFDSPERRRLEQGALPHGQSL